MQQLFNICDQIKKANEKIKHNQVEGDFIKFTTHVQRRNLENAEYELKERLREILKIEGQDKFNEAVLICKGYMEEAKEENQDYEISYFRNVKETTPTTINLSKFLFSTKHAQSIEDYRTMPQNEEKATKKQMFPCATISGTFTKRSIEGINKYNGLAVFDFDAKDNQALTAEGMKAILSNLKETYYCGLSLGGQGVYAIFKTDNKDPKKHFEMTEGLGEILKNFGLTFDKACKDESRLRFISYDPSSYFNPQSDIFKINTLPKKEVKQLSPRIYTNCEQNTTRAKIDRCITQIEAQGINIADDYADWISIGFSIASELGRDGEETFLRASQFSGKFDPSKCSKKYDNLQKHCKKGSIGVFFNICKKYGIDIR